MNNNRIRGKTHQKKTAKTLNGIDIGILGGMDVLTDKFSIECKSRKAFVAVSWYDQAKKNSKNKIPLLVVHVTGKQYKNDLVILSIQDFKSLMEEQ